MMHCIDKRTKQNGVPFAKRLNLENLLQVVFFLLEKIRKRIIN